MHRILKGVGAALLILLIILAGYEYWRVRVAQATTREIFATYLASNNIQLRVEDLTSWQIETLLKIQDPGFYEHDGVDGRTLGSGQTTITQSLVKRFYFQKFKPGFAKIEQTLIARYAVDPAIDKASQITAFINITPMGKCGGASITGFTAAALCYYQHPITDLSKDEYISLVAILIGPTTYNPVTRPDAHLERVNRLKKYLNGDCLPTNAHDVYYTAC